jgi:hypothetical protein
MFSEHWSLESTLGIFMSMKTLIKKITSIIFTLAHRDSLHVILTHISLTERNLPLKTFFFLAVQLTSTCCLDFLTALQKQQLHAPFINSPFIGRVLWINLIFFIRRYSLNFGLGLPPWNSPFHFCLLDLRPAVSNMRPAGRMRPP